MDEEAAEIVRRIYTMYLDGMGIGQIAAALTSEKVLTPTAYWKSKGIRRGGVYLSKDPYFWRHSTVAKTLTLREYCGDVINFKTYSKSYKNKKRLVNPEENRVVFENVHEPIIDRDTWEKISAKRGKTRQRKCSDGEKNMFSGLLVCADCGSNLNFHFNQKNRDITYFNCSNYNNHNKTCFATHYIRTDFLDQIVLCEIRRLTAFAAQYEDSFLRLAQGKSAEIFERENRRKQKEFDTLRARDRELDVLFERLYEDSICQGRMSNS